MNLSILIIAMHHNTLNQYLKNGHKENNYNCLNIGNLCYMYYYNYHNNIDVYMCRGTSQISDENGVNYIIYKDLTSVEIFIYERYYIRLPYYKK